MTIKRFVACVAVLVLTIGVMATPAAPQLAGRSTEEWIKALDSPTRLAGLKIDETVARLKLKPGDVVADIGAGTGAFDGALAKAVPQGKVYAVDIDQGLLDSIETKKRNLQIANIQTVLGKFTDPNLPTRDVDVAFIFDVLHHIDDRATYLKNLSGYLTPSGRVAVVEFIPGKGGHREMANLQITVEQGNALMAAAGWQPLEDVSLFDDKWFVIYGKR